MSVAGRTSPPCVRQTLENSCWAAVLDSWSRADPRMPRLQQGPLISQWGEGPTGGITPETKIPQIAAAYGLRLPTARLRYVTEYLRSHVNGSYIFCAYYLPSGWMHTILVYRVSDNDVSFMDPDPGTRRVWSMEQFEQLGSYIIMHKP